MSGLVYVFTGEGKGKTSAALGVATRSLLLGKRVVWVAFYKSEDWQMAEKGLTSKFEKLEMIFGGRGFHIGKKTAPVGDKGHVVVDTASEDEHREAARASLKIADEKLLTKPFLMVMDEVINAVNEGLVGEEELLRLLSLRGESHVVLTGRGVSSGVKKVADLVTECKKIKHPYDKGELAVRGLDY